MFAIVCTVCLFTACSDDDDEVTTSDEPTADEPAVLTLDEIAGSYTGDLMLDTEGWEAETTTIKVTKTGDNQVNILLEDFEFLTMSVGDVSVDCTTTLNTTGDEFTLSGDSELTLNLYSLQYTMPFTLSGTADGKTFSMKFDLASVPFIGDLSVSFEGTKD